MMLRRLVFATGALAMQAGCSWATAASQDVPLPRPKPVQPQVEQPRLDQPQIPEVKFSNIDENEPDDGAECKAALSAAGARYDWIGTATEGECTIGNAVELLSVNNGTDMISFRQKPVMACDFAALMARWAGEVAGPVIAGHTGAQLQSITTGPGIVCRKRVGGAQTKISEHAKGNALDITGFGLSDNRSIQIMSELEKSEQLALKALRTSACGYFTTVLGPGANPAHKHHFHFDFKKRGKSYNYRICE